MLTLTRKRFTRFKESTASLDIKLIGLGLVITNSDVHPNPLRRPPKLEGEHVGGMII